MLWINPEAFGRGRNLDCTSSQDSSRCESCLATKHEILSAGRWFIFLLLQLGGNGKIETLRKGNGYRLFPPFSLPRNSWTLSRIISIIHLFFVLLLQWHDNVEECWKGTTGEHSTRLDGKLEAMVHVESVICMSLQTQFPAQFRDIYKIWPAWIDNYTASVSSCKLHQFLGSSML